MGQLSLVDCGKKSGEAVSMPLCLAQVPSVFCLPEHFNVSFLRDSPLHIDGPVSSKACGEPPQLLAASVLLALQVRTQNDRAWRCQVEWVGQPAAAHSCNRC